MNLTLILSCNNRFGIGFVINDVRSLYPMTVTTEPSPPRALVDWWPRSQILLLSVFFPYYRILYDLFWVGIFVTFLWYLCLFKTTARVYCKEKVRELFNFFNVWEVRKIEWEKFLYLDNLSTKGKLGSLYYDISLNS